MKWGIIGYGEITPSFIEGLKSAHGAELKFIASNSSFEYLASKKLYAKVEYFKVYEDLLASDIDIVYISTTNNLHFENVKMVLEAGKHCLCEKPMTPTLHQTQELIDLAESKNLFLMEGMWTRFLPAYREFLKILRSGLIGEPKLLKADFGFFNDWPKNRRLLNPLLLGGTLLDNADYNIFLSQDVFSDYPSEVNAMATFAETGVEDACSISLLYPSGGMAQLYSSFRCQTKQEAVVYGNLGSITLHEYWHGTEIVLNINETQKVIKFPFRSNGFEYEIQSVQNSILKGEIENNFVSHFASEQVAQIIDDIKVKIEKYK